MRWVQLWVGLLLALTATSPALADDAGRALYVANCASCHGAYGEGDGPAALDMGAPLPDLRYLAKRNGGAFPAAAVAEIIDGREFVKAHGPRPMPVWGDAFEALTGNAATANARIKALVDYLATIQQRD
jgi:mono/diheme cytochrome c family protein